MTDASYPLTVFYDGACPVCSAEMLQLQSEDRHQRIVLDDVSGEAGRDGRLGVGQQALLDCIHAVTVDGRLLKGVDVFEQVYRAVGRDRAASAMGWPLMRWLAERSYPLFVRHRHRIPAFVGPMFWPEGARQHRLRVQAQDALKRSQTCQDGACAHPADDAGNHTGTHTGA